MSRPTEHGVGEKGVIARYRAYLPVGETTPVVSLGEGSTPLIHSDRISEEVSADVWLKYEGLNPTGSFKDRGMSVAISKALEERSTAVVCASTGNTSASAAAYAARAGLRCVVLIPGGHVARGKLAQASVHGARVLEIEDNFDRALELVQEVARDHPVTVVNSVNPYRLEGQKTAAFEIVESLGKAPQVHVMPVGNAGNITAYWRGYREARSLGWTDPLPRMFGFQASGAAPIVRGEIVTDPQTVATAIRIGNPASWAGAIEAATDSEGAIGEVDDQEISRAHHDLAHEGIFVELASAASVAGLRRLARSGQIAAGDQVVCVLTGHGLKDPDSVIASTPAARTIAPDAKSLLEGMI